MFENIIEFKAKKEYLDQKQDLPKAIKLNIPQWFKDLEHKYPNMTVKGCMPFLDTLTTGYVLSLTQPYLINHNILDEHGNRTSKLTPAMSIAAFGEIFNLNSRGEDNIHPEFQVQNSPLAQKNKNLQIQKFINPWIIKTPPGYSCLFLPPMNNQDDRFSIIPGIVDTDKYDNQINFPFVINGDKYPILETILKRGTPFVQVIPFKRESWKIKISEYKKDELITNKLKFHLNSLIHNYKSNNWQKKSWK
tara:strand:+ start:1292 stop:2035 length:744 start_codon:yes stop_codon:yes gene_type:complete